MHHPLEFQCYFLHYALKIWIQSQRAWKNERRGMCMNAIYVYPSRKLTSKSNENSFIKFLAWQNRANCKIWKQGSITGTAPDSSLHLYHITQSYTEHVRQKYCCRSIRIEWRHDVLEWDETAFGCRKRLARVMYWRWEGRGRTGLLQNASFKLTKTVATFENRQGFLVLRNSSLLWPISWCWRKNYDKRKGGVRTLCCWGRLCVGKWMVMTE